MKRLKFDVTRIHKSISDVMKLNSGGGPDSIKVIRKGVLIEVGLEGNPSDPVNRVVIEIDSKRDETLRIALVCPVNAPWTTAELSVDRIPGGEWTIEGPHRVVLETVVTPDERMTTGYTVPTTHEGTPDGLLQAPKIRSITPVDDIDADTPVAPAATNQSSASSGPKSLAPVADRLGSIKSMLTKAGRETVSEAVGDREPEPGEGHSAAIPEVSMEIDEVSITRNVEVTEDQVAITNRISLDGHTPRRLLVVDPFPAELTVESIQGPFEPYSSGVLDARPHVVIEGLVAPDRPIDLTYSLSMEIPPLAALEQGQTARPPWFELTVQQTESMAPSQGNDSGPTVLLVAQQSIVTAGRPDTDRSRTTSLELRLRHLESRLAETTAYSAELKRFIDAYDTGDIGPHGSGAGGSDRSRQRASDRAEGQRFDDLHSEIADLRSIVAAHEDRITANESRWRSAKAHGDQAWPDNRSGPQEK